MSEQQMTYEQYVDHLLKHNGLFYRYEFRSMGSKERVLHRSKGINAKAGYAAYQSRTITEEEGK